MLNLDKSHHASVFKDILKMRKVYVKNVTLNVNIVLNNRIIVKFAIQPIIEHNKFQIVYVK